MLKSRAKIYFSLRVDSPAEEVVLVESTEFPLVNVGFIPLSARVYSPHCGFRVADGI